LSNQSFKKVLRLNKVSPSKILIASLIAIISQPFISLVAITMQQLFPSYGMMYMPTSGEVGMGGLIFSLFLIALTPAICEEVFMRGVVLSGHRGLKVSKVAIFNGVLFGLFHNNFDQMFYAAAFGAILAFVVLYTDSIYPAVIMHFIMNGLSVLGDFYPENFYTRVTYLYESNIAILIPLGIASLVAVTLLVVYLKRQSSKKANELIIEQQEEASKQNESINKIAYPEWPLIFATAISIVYSVVG